MPITQGSNVVIRTRDAYYSSARIVAMNPENISIEYCTGLKEVKGEIVKNNRFDTIRVSDLISISERT